MRHITQNRRINPNLLEIKEIITIGHNIGQITQNRNNRSQCGKNYSKS